MNLSKILLKLFFSFAILLDIRCKKLIEIDAPFTSVNESNVYAVDATAIAVLTGIYTNMSNSGMFNGNQGISLLAGLSADELTLYNGVSNAKYKAYYTNSLAANINQSFGSEYWSTLYNYVFACNAALEGILKSTTLTSSVRQQLLGEALFTRAFFYYYLVNFFGDVPLIISTDNAINANPVRENKMKVYEQIIEDLRQALEFLSTDYLNGSLQPYTGTKERLRPTKWAAIALLARVYLSVGNYSSAEEFATSIINNSSNYKLTNLNEVFLKNSFETIWQLQPVLNGHNTEDGLTFIVPASGPSDVNGPSGNPVYLNTSLLNAFDSTDQRKVNGNWINSISVLGTTYYYPFKYKKTTFSGGLPSEYLMVLRLAEQYLIRAEARAQIGNLSGAQADLNVIRNRAGLKNTTALDKPSLLSAIMHERQVELFTEWGHRWFDLKRTLNIDIVMNLVTPQKAGGASWKSYQQLYPLPIGDLQKASNLFQNPGY